MKLFLIRHGETDHNRDGLALGRADVPLNTRGHHQARQLAEALKDYGLAAVYTSPLQRTVATARPIAEACGLPLRVCDGLIEMDVGHMDGMSLAEVREQYKEFLERWRGAEAGTVAMPGGESLSQVQERAWSAVDEIRKVHPEESVAAVTHNFVILSLLCRALGVDLADFRRFRHDLAAVTILDLRNDRTLLVRLNDTCHLVGTAQASW